MMALIPKYNNRIIVTTTLTKGKGLSGARADYDTASCMYRSISTSMT